MKDWIKNNRILASILGVAVCIVLGVAVWAVSVLLDISRTSSPVAPAGMQRDAASTTFTLPACAPECPGPWRSPGWRRHHPDLFPEEAPQNTGTP